MSYDKKISQLLELRPEEMLGKELAIRHGRNMSHAEFIFLKQSDNCHTLAQLLTSTARREQQKIKDAYSKQYRDTGLPEKDFFPAGKDIIIEQLLRFVDIPQHSHFFYEFVYLFTGSCVHRIAGEDFRQEAGSFTVIPPSTAHALYPDEGCLCLTVKVRGHSFYKMELPDFVRFIYPTVILCGEDSFVPSLILNLYLQQESQKQHHEQLIIHLFQSLILYILQQFQHHSQLLTSNSSKDIHMMEILNYMVNHYNTITLHTVAEHFHYNASYFSDRFHRQTGVTFTATLRKFRLGKAAQMLLETELTVAEICASVGYRDVTQFIRNFKALYNTTPAQYRKNQTSET